MAPMLIPQDLTETIGTANMVGIVLSIMTYGVHLTLYVFLVRLYFDRSPYAVKLRRPSKSDCRTLIYATFLFLLATAGICLQTWLNQKAFIKHRDFPGGPLAYMVVSADDAGNLAITAIYVILNWFADGILLYRFYILFGSTRYALAACIMISTSLIVTGSIFVPSIATLGINLWTDTNITPSVSYLSLSLAINVVLTFAIIIRLLYLRHQILGVLGDASGQMYTLLAMMFVESASLYTIIALVCVVAAGINSPVQIALLPMLGQLQAIPPLLIAIRVLECRVVTPDTDSTRMAFTNPPASDSSVSAPYNEKWQLPPSPQHCLSRPVTVTYEKRSFNDISPMISVDSLPMLSHPRYKTPSLLVDTGAYKQKDSPEGVFALYSETHSFATTSSTESELLTPLSSVPLLP